jgi:hypothetical protein
MKEHPILFKGQMVRAILDGSKTLTRRLKGLSEVNKNPEMWNLQDLSINPELLTHNKDGEEKIFIKKGLIATFENTEFGEYYINVRCPYGEKKGDRLWVRETWLDQIGDQSIGYYLYRADLPWHWNAEDTEHGEEVAMNAEDYKWKPSIHMPREASRILLEVDEIKIERIQDISTDDIKVEGIIQRFPKVNDQFTPDILKGQFFELWNSINSKRGFGWDKNPWVWVVKFKVI